MIHCLNLIYFLSGNVPTESLSQKPADGDLLSVLLDKGNKLREQMIISSLESKSKVGHNNHPDPSTSHLADFLPSHGAVDLSMRLVHYFIMEFIKFVRHRVLDINLCDKRSEMF